MRPGPPRGETASCTVTVTADKSARVDGREIHPIYGTVALLADIEALCRRVIEPHLEPGEEGVGAGVDLRHRAPVPIGEEVTLVATVATVDRDRLVCEVLARHRGALVARGSFEQRIVPSAVFAAEIEARRAAGG